MIQPTVITTSGSLAIEHEGVRVAVVRAVAHSARKCRYYLHCSERTSVVRVKEESDGTQPKP